MVTNDKIDLMLCILCGEDRGVGLNFCRACMKEHSSYIESNPTWLRALQTSHQRERRRAVKELNVSLDAIIENMTKHRFL